MLGSAFPSMTSNTRGDLAFRALLLSLMTIKPKPRCRVRGFVEEMGAFLRRPVCMSLEGGEANWPRPHNNENSDGFQSEKPGHVTLRVTGLLACCGKQKGEGTGLAPSPAFRAGTTGASPSSTIKSTKGAPASVGALLVLSFRPESRGWLFCKSRDAYSS